MSDADPRIRRDADLLFEVAPKAKVFDVVRQCVNDAVADQYGDVIAADDFRASVRTDHVELVPDEWIVDVTIEGDNRDMQATVSIDADGDAEAAVTAYIEAEASDRFGVDPDRLRYQTIRLAAGGWFVEAAYEGE